LSRYRTSGLATELTPHSIETGMRLISDKRKLQTKTWELFFQLKRENSSMQSAQRLRQLRSISHLMKRLRLG